jgi:hypothetical protein
VIAVSPQISLNYRTARFMLKYLTIASIVLWIAIGAGVFLFGGGSVPPVGTMVGFWVGAYAARLDHKSARYYLYTIPLSIYGFLLGWLFWHLANDQVLSSVGDFLIGGLVHGLAFCALLPILYAFDKYLKLDGSADSKKKEIRDD